MHADTQPLHIVRIFSLMNYIQPDIDILEFINRPQLLGNKYYCFILYYTLIAYCTFVLYIHRYCEKIWWQNKQTSIEFLEIIYRGSEQLKLTLYYYYIIRTIFN